MDPPKAKRVKCHTTVWPVIWPISLPRTGIAHCAPSCLAFTRVLRTHKYVTSAVHFLSLHRRNLKNKLSLPFTFKSLKKVVEFHRKHRGKVEVVKKKYTSKLFSVSLPDPGSLLIIPAFQFVTSSETQSAKNRIIELVLALGLVTYLKL